MAHQEIGKANGNIIELEDGLAVRALRADDAKVYALAANSQKVLGNLRNRIPNPYTEASAIWWIEHNQTPEAQARCGKWSQETGAEGPLIPVNYCITVNDIPVGSIGLQMGEDVYFRSAEVGYWLGDAYWGQRIMSRVVPAFVQWVWKTFDVLVRLNGETSEANVASAALLKKAGFQYEGRRPDAICKNGRLMASLMWGMLRPTP